MYAYGGDVNIKVNNQIYKLEDCLNNGIIKVADIILKSNIKEPIIYKDGGSVEYQYQDYKIIKFNTIKGNKDVYFGNNDMNINDLGKENIYE